MQLDQFLADQMNSPWMQGGNAYRCNDQHTPYYLSAPVTSNLWFGRACPTPIGADGAVSN